MPTIIFQFSIMSKWLAKHIITNVFFKITIMKRHVYIDIGWTWIWNQWFYLGIWNDDRTKIIVLNTFQLATRLNSQKTTKLSSFMNYDTLNCLWILVFASGIIEFSTSGTCFFFTLFQFLKIKLKLAGYLNTRKSFPICMLVVMASGKCDLHIHLTFLQEF